MAISRAKTSDNAANLAPAFLDKVLRRYAGTRLGRQELDGEMIEDRPDALWSRDLDRGVPCRAAPPLVRIVVAVDPPASSSKRADACGIVAAGIDDGGIAYVLSDDTASGLKPPEWAAKAVALYRRLQADALVVEINQGGEMVTRVIREVDPSVPVTSVRATRGKYLRAEPVSVLYAQGRVRHVGASDRAGRRTLRFRPRRPDLRPLARPPRCARLGAHGVDAAREERAAGEGALTPIPRLSNYALSTE